MSEKRIRNLVEGVNDLFTINAELAAEADGWDPKKVVFNSTEKRYWKCKLGHRWIAPINIRQRVGTGCPVCSNNKIVQGLNDLATLYPDLALEADGWDPTRISVGSSRKLSWKCSLNHKWDAVVFTRTKLKSGCPYCGRKTLLSGFNDIATINPDLALEADGWDPSQYLTGTTKKLSWKCSKGHQWVASARSRKHKVTGCPVCSNNSVIKGVNDLSTLNPKLALEAYGWDPSTFSVGSDKSVQWKCLNYESHIWKAKIYSRSQGKGCPYCSNQKTLLGFNDLKTTHSDLASQAFGWDPTKFTAGSEKILKWKCELFSDHIWKASIKARVSGTGCPYCSHNLLLKGFNDLATRYPELASEAYGWDPSEVITATGKKFQWKCPQDSSHIWRTSIVSRIAGTSCPTCNPLGGFNSSEKGYLYFLRHNDWEMLQIGITNYPDKRLATHRKLGWEVLEIRGPSDGWIVQDWETQILRMLKQKGAKLAPAEIAGKFDGFTEAWIESSYPVNSIKDLIAQSKDYLEG